MATQKQENLYNKIMKYYNFIDQIIDLSREDAALRSDREFQVVESIIHTLEDCADAMAEEFINYIKQPKSEQIKAKISIEIDKIVAKVYESKEKMLYIEKHPENYDNL